MVEVLVAGGGPAGAVAATLLARAGVRVLLVDRASFPRDKLCGDTLNPGAVAVLARLGLARKSGDEALPIDGMIVTGERGVRVIGRYGSGQHAWAIRRREFDLDLLATAAAAGVHVEEGVAARECIVQETRRGPEVRGLRLTTRESRPLRVPACVTIAADGRHSTIAFGLGLARHPVRPRRWAAGAYFENVEGLSSFGEMHVRRRHYIGVAPLPGGLTNVCVVSADRALFRNPGELVRGAIAADRQLQDRFARARLVGPAVSIGPLAVEARDAGLRGLLLAGDAAGFIDPMTGDGLRFALLGGEMAARAALEMLETGVYDGHVCLARRRREQFRGKWRLNRVLRSLVGSPRGVGCASVAAFIAPSVVGRLIRIAGDTPSAPERAG
jgi:flavin-dependent dehydrogenase